MKISVYVRNKDWNPSSYYRIIQYVENLSGDVKIRNLTTGLIYRESLNNKYSLVRKILQGILYLQIVGRSICYLMEDSREPGIIIVQREIIPRHTPGLVRILEKRVCRRNKVIWDLDDNIFESGEISLFEKKLLEKNADVIIVTNKYLAKKISSDTEEKIRCLITTDKNIHKKFNSYNWEQKLSVYTSEINLVWVGTSGNIIFLEKIVPYIDQAAKIIKKEYNKQLYLNVVSGNKLDVKCNSLIINNIEWSRERTSEVIIQSHIGIMPLDCNEFTKYKGGFKLIQYLSASLPIIGSAVGINQDIISQEVGYLITDDFDWCNRIVELATNEKEYVKKSHAALDLWKSEFSDEKILNELEKILMEVSK